MTAHEKLYDKYVKLARSSMAQEQEIEKLKAETIELHRSNQVGAVFEYSNGDKEFKHILTSVRGMMHPELLERPISFKTTFSREEIDDWVDECYYAQDTKQKKENK